MKFAKLSLAAIMAMSVSAFADVQNIKVSGDAKLYYSTDDSGNNDLFDQKNSAGQAAFDIAAEASLANGVAGKVSFTVLSTLGLENNLVSNVWEGGTATQWWASEAWIAKTFAKTTVKVGRQTLDTPLAFTETWSIAQNTFDAAVVLNQDLPKTTLIAAWVGQGNGGGVGLGKVVAPAPSSVDPFTTYGNAIGAEGAYAFGVVTKAIPMTTAQAWYYDVVNAAQAYWLQADVAINGLGFGAQFANVDASDAGLADDTNAYALKVSYKMNDLSVSAAYSSVDNGDAFIRNTATNYTTTAQSKLYTEAWWTYGEVSAPDTDAWNLTAEYSIKDIADLGLYYTGTSTDNVNHSDMTEVALTAGKSFGNLDTTLAYIYTDFDAPNSDAVNTVQVYLTYNF